MPLFKEEQTLEIQEAYRRPGIYISKSQLLGVVVAVVAVVTGIGLMCYFLPDRGCLTSEPRPTTTTPTTTEGTTNTKMTSTSITSMTSTSITSMTSTSITSMTSTSITSMTNSSTASTELSTAIKSDSPTMTKTEPVTIVTTVKTVTQAPWLGRLTTDIIPQSYDLYIKPYINIDVNRRFTFDGNVTIRVTCNASTSRITLHALNITILDVHVVIVQNNVDIIQSWELADEYQFLHIDVNQNLEEGEDYDIVISYVGEINSDMVGLYRTSYDYQGATLWLATSNMKPSHARRALPCFDEPDFRAVFRVRIEHRTSMEAISNGIEIGRVDLENGWTTTTFNPTPRMSTYNLAFTVADFSSVEMTTANNVTLRLWSNPDGINSTQYALEIGSEVIAYYGEYLGVEFPLEKQDLIDLPSAASPDLQGTSSLYYSPATDSLQTKQRVASTVAHMLSQQWLENLVAPLWWDDVWVNEGLASYLEYLSMDSTEPTWDVNQLFLVDDLYPVMSLDSLSTSHAVRAPVGSPEEDLQLSDSISSKKGSSILRMLNNILGGAVFRQGLSDYLNRFSHGNADTDDLWFALSQADASGAGTDVKAIMDPWTLQMGYPLVTFSRTDRTTVAVTQEHYLTDSSPSYMDDDNDVSLWMVYIQYTHGSATNFGSPDSVWMRNERSIELDLGESVSEDDWYIANTYQHGYYRVNYDDTNWQRLTNQLIEDHEVIPVENRAQLLNDAFTLVGTGQLSYGTALNLTRYLGDELMFSPWETTLSYMTYITSMLRLSSAYGPLEIYMRVLVTPLYNQLGWEDSDAATEQYNRNNAIHVACFYRLDDCMERASSLYLQYMQNPENNPISNNLKSTVYCNGIRQGRQAEWEFGWAKYRSTTDSTERAAWLSALGCTRQPWLLNQYLQYSIDEDSGISTSDVPLVIKAVANNEVGLPLVWDFFRTEYDILFAYFGNSFFTFPEIISSITVSFNTNQDLEELVEFGKGRDFGSGEHAYQQAIATTTSNIQWMEDHEVVIADWLDNAFPVEETCECW